MAGPEGVEPSPTGPKPAVLPLYYGPSIEKFRLTFFLFMAIEIREDVIPNLPVLSLSK